MNDRWTEEEQLIDRCPEYRNRVSGYFDKERQEKNSRAFEILSTLPRRKKSSKKKDKVNYVVNYRFIKQVKTYTKFDFSSLMWG